MPRRGFHNSRGAQAILTSSSLHPYTPAGLSILPSFWLDGLYHPRAKTKRKILQGTNLQALPYTLPQRKKLRRMTIPCLKADWSFPLSWSPLPRKCLFEVGVIQEEEGELAEGVGMVTVTLDVTKAALQLVWKWRGILLGWRQVSVQWQFTLTLHEMRLEARQQSFYVFPL